MSTTEYGSIDRLPVNDHQFTQSSLAGRLPPLRLCLAALLICLGAPLHYGFQLTLTNPSEQSLIQFANASLIAHYGARMERQQIELVWSTTVALFFAGSLFGSLFINQIADVLGRKRGILLTNAVICACAALNIAAYWLTSIELFAICRFLLGFWGTIGIGLNAVFLTECSPKRCRGAVGIATAVFVQIGTILGAILGIPQCLGNSDHWWYIFAIEVAILCGILPLQLAFLQETPNYLLMMAKSDQSRKSLQFYHDILPEWKTEQILCEIRAELKENVAECQGMIRVWHDTRRTTRVGLRVAIVLGASMAFCGIAILDAYLVGMFQEVGFSILTASIANVGIQLGGLIFGLASLFLVDHFGRRPLLLCSFGAMFVTNVCITVLMLLAQIHPTVLLIRYILLLAIACFLFEFEFGLGTLFFFVTTELVATNVRSATLGWASVTHAFLRAIVLALYLPLTDLIGDPFAYALVVLPVLLMATIYLFVAMPETKNRSLLELEAQLN